MVSPVEVVGQLAALWAEAEVQGVTHENVLEVQEVEVVH